MRARYYSPDMMRFINEDIVTGDISNSNSLNRYSYVEGNPVTMVDPFGLEAMRARAQALEDKKVLDGVKFLGGLVLVCVPGLQGVGTGLLVSGATGLVVDILAQEKNLDPKTMAIIEEAASIGEGVVAFFIPGGQGYAFNQICSGVGGLGAGFASEGIYKAVTGEDSEDAFVIGDGIGNIVCGFAGDAAWKYYQKQTVEKIATSAGMTKQPVQAYEVTSYEDFQNRSVVGDGLEGHEIWQHANLNENGYATRRLSTSASKNNPVIALPQDVHVEVNDVQRILAARTQTPVENILSNADILYNNSHVPDAQVDILLESALKHYKNVTKGN